MIKLRPSLPIAFESLPTIVVSLPSNISFAIALILALSFKSL
jgi:hypothetical protein